MERRFLPLCQSFLALVADKSSNGFKPTRPISWDSSSKLQRDSVLDFEWKSLLERTSFSSTWYFTCPQTSSKTCTSSLQKVIMFKSRQFRSPFVLKIFVWTADLHFHWKNAKAVLSGFSVLAGLHEGRPWERSLPAAAFVHHESYSFLRSVLETGLSKSFGALWRFISNGCSLPLSHSQTSAHHSNQLRNRPRWIISGPEE